MSKSAILAVLIFGPAVLFGQNISITFTSTDLVTGIDSVTATNLTTKQQVTLPGNETLVLSFNDGMATVYDFNKVGRVFPNPFSGETSFRTTIQNPQTVALRVQNLMGQVVAQTRAFIRPGEQAFNLTVSAEGIYLVSFSSDAGTATYKIICTETNSPVNSIRYLGSTSPTPDNQNNHDNASQPDLKSSQTGYILGYHPGNVIRYECRSDVFISIFTDSPVTSRNYDIEFVNCTDRDRKGYSIVKIGAQTWMAENLAYLPSVGPSIESSGYWVYGYEGRSIPEAKNLNHYRTYGVLYRWDYAQNACPAGWILPTDGDWKILEKYLGMRSSEADSVGWRTSGSAGTQLKSASGWNGNGQGRNSSGFNALPGGLRFFQVYHEPATFSNLGANAYFWTATGDGNFENWSRTLADNNHGVARGSFYPGVGYSVRCLLGAGARLAILTTMEIKNITGPTALGGGTITNDGGAAITARGVCWSTAKTPSVNDQKTIDGAGTGSFSSNLTDLKGTTAYYACAYATSSFGTSYGSEVSFTTGPGLPTVTTENISVVQDTTAWSGGDITNDGGASISARGVCWSTQNDPTVADHKTTDGTGDGIFTSRLAGLTPGATYFVRSYATNRYGTSYGKGMTLSTADGSFVYDHRIYGYKNIGTQTWMMENLAYLPSVNPPASGSDTTSFYYIYGYEGSDTAAAKGTENYKAYGVLYNWPAAMNGSTGSLSNPGAVQGVCPEGWHLPGDEEWKTLEMYLGMSKEDADGENFRSSGSVGNQLKEAGNSHWNIPNAGANNSSGFYALPGGLWSGYGPEFTMLNDAAFFWSSTDGGASGETYGPWFRSLDNRIADVNRYFDQKRMGFSVRCVLGQGAVLPSVTTDAVTGITDTSAICGGAITQDGRTTIIARGVCLSTSPDPTITGNGTTDGAGTGSFTSILNGLHSATTYYIRAYATNCAGTGYGNQISFKTAPGLPTVTTSGISGIRDTSAFSGGNIINDGGMEITARGVCWSTGRNPVLAERKPSDGTGTGEFNSILTGLTANSIYYAWAHAVNSIGSRRGSGYLSGWMASSK